MDSLGHDLFSGTGPSLDENIGGDFGEAIDQSVHLAHFSTLTNEVGELISCTNLPAQRDILVHEGLVGTDELTLITALLDGYRDEIREGLKEFYVIISKCSVCGSVLKVNSADRFRSYSKRCAED